jgi:hypothetical protein
MIIYTGYSDFIISIRPSTYLPSEIRVDWIHKEDSLRIC